MQFSSLQRQDQVQKQTFSPSLIKGMQLLALPYPSLVSFLERHALENPFLELRDDWPSCGDPRSAEPEALFRRSAMDPAPLFHCPDPMETLHEHLRLQLLAADIAPALRTAGLRVIQRIDDRGYLEEDPEAIAVQERLPAAEVRDALAVVKTFSPAGVGASDLRECLLLQAAPEKRGLLELLLSGPTDKLAARDVRFFAKRCGVSAREIEDAFACLAGLTPYPGQVFAPSAPIHYIYPEIEIHASDGILSFRFQSGCDLVSADEALYRELSRQAEDGSDDLDYIRNKYREAVALVQGLSLRKSTVEKLILFLMHVQRDFFLHPGSPLRPVTMRQAAEALGMHPSTITRCVNGRYIQTRDGILPLKELFPQRLPGAAGREVSAAEVKDMIRSIVGEESPERPASDQSIADRLTANGMELSRRTVAKYREQLGIPESRARRRKGASS